MISTEVIEAFKRLASKTDQYPVEIVIYQPGGLGGSPTVAIRSIEAGFDWNNGKILIHPSEPLSKLNADEVAAILKSVRQGQSWHAYQKHKQYEEQLSAAREEIARLKEELEKVSDKY